MVRKLAEAKSYLEKRLGELEQETLTLRSILAALDEVLTEKSFKRVTVKEKIEGKSRQKISRSSDSQEKLTLSTIDDVLLGELFIKENEIILIPVKSMEFRVDLPPFASFLVKRVLDSIRLKDEKSAASGLISSNKIFNYEIDEEHGILKTIRINNYHDSKQLNELKNSIRWTLRRLYEQKI